MLDLSCLDWEDRLREGRSLLPDNLNLNQEEIEYALQAFGNLKLPDVVGTPSLHEASGEWSRDLVRAVFGSFIDDRRTIQEYFTLVPKKNSKTTTGAAVMVTALLMNKRPRAEFLLIGPTQEIADTAYQQAAGMIEADLYLQDRFQVRDHLKVIVDRTNKSFLKIKTFDMKVMTGTKPTGVLVDELHVMSNISYASRVIGQVRGGLDPRPEGFLIFITTQSDQPPAGVFKQELQFARGIRDGKITGKAATMLPLLYEFPERMQTGEEREWEDVKNWPMVMPNLGLSINIERLESTFSQAKEKGEEEVRRWASQHLNVEIGMALHDDRWAGADHWESAIDKEIDLQRIIQECDVVTVGIDGGGLDDLLSLSVVGRSMETRQWLGWGKSWCQQEVLEKRKQEAERFIDFQEDGDLVICENPTEDINELCDIVEILLDSGLLPKQNAVGLDPIGVTSIVDELAERGITNEQMVAVPQGFRLSGAIWGLERKLKDGTFYHCGSPLFNWSVGNAKAENRGNAIYITKQAAGRAKIDPLIALFNAVQLMSRNPESETVNKSPFEDEEYRLVS